MDDERSVAELVDEQDEEQPSHCLVMPVKDKAFEED